ncbi:alpha/beta fold hydrolase [Jatrophihabitans lederbergiae]|uniref:Alpha/beta hydrolase n=1 Tax=Jatrophihabitans lederbergiae TaxID=3075547 RepID=A0ABU2JHK0_9ACTN|nr:alpha/beta hydrolase [Jatrophihabitans sp. DSM 44399]MDT0264208.1 alpha/beta hydrolase [Jatrophihabitans sp. DSM 44399]
MRPVRFDRVMHARISTAQVNRHFTPSIPDMDLRPGLAAVRCPVLVLVGEHDPMVPPSNAEQAVAAIPVGLATLHRGPNAGHQVLWDAPDVVEDLLRPFVSRCTTDADSRT